MTTTVRPGLTVGQVLQAEIGTSRRLRPKWLVPYGFRRDSSISGRPKEKLEQAIADLEDMQRAKSISLPPSLSGGKRPGRKSMGAEERKAVSRRMKNYWANRRKAEQG